MVHCTAQSVHLMHDINVLCKSSAGDSLPSTSPGKTRVVVVVFVVVCVVGGGVFSSLRAIRTCRGRYY